MRSGTLLILIMLCAPAGPETRPAGGDIDGTWEWKGHADIVGGRTGRILEIAPGDAPANKLVAITRVRHHPDRQTEPEAARFGPFEARVEENTLILKHPVGPARYSFTMEGDTLTLPAFVRKCDKEILIEASHMLDLDVRSRDGETPPLTVREWRWVFSAAPESAERGTGHFGMKATPDPLKVSTTFDFEWEWREDHLGRRRIMIWRKGDGGTLVESGGFLLGETGKLEWYSSGEDRVGPFDTARSYVPADRSTTRPAVESQP